MVSTLDRSEYFGDTSNHIKRKCHTRRVRSGNGNFLPCIWRLDFRSSNFWSCRSLGLAYISSNTSQGFWSNFRRAQSRIWFRGISNLICIWTGWSSLVFTHDELLFWSNVYLFPRNENRISVFILHFYRLHKKGREGMASLRGPVGLARVNEHVATPPRALVKMAQNTGRKQF